MLENILFILVIYNKVLEVSVAYQSLKLLLGGSLNNCLYVHDNTNNNIFLAAAYNKGLAEANRRGKEWIVLLDDDTELSSAYLEELMKITITNSVAAAPILIDSKGEQLSPTYYNKHRGPFLINSTHKNNVTNVLNSGFAIRCSTIEKIGNFNTNFPLDYLDVYTCFMLYKVGVTIDIMPTKLVHNLSIKDYEHNVSRNRYLSYLQGEHDFAYAMGGKALFYYRLRLIGRVIKWSFTRHLYVKETIYALFKK